MYNVSNYYKTKIESKDPHVFTFRINVRKSRKSDILATLTESDVESDSIKISRQATSNNYFTVGGVCSAKLSLILTNKGVAKLDALGLISKNMCFEYIEWLKTDDPNQSTTDITKNTDNTENTSGKVPFGFFYINTIQNTDYNCSLELYDAMLAFSADITYNDGIILSQGFRTIKELLMLFCESCSNDVYDLTIASDIESRIANNKQTFSVGNDGQIDSYRNGLGYLSILAGGFIIINRSGDLDIVHYNNTILALLDENDVVECKMSEAEFELNGISTSVAGFDYRVKNKNSGSKLAMIFLNENPFLRGIQEADAKELNTAIKTSINNVLTAIQGVKFDGGDIDAIARPELDLGDCISISRAIIDYDTREVLTKQYKYVILCSIEHSFYTYDSLSCNSYNLEESYTTKASSSFKTSSGGGSGSAVSSYYSLYLTKDINLQAGRQVKLFNVLLLLNKGIGAMASFVAICNVTGVGSIQFDIVYDNVTHPIKPRYTLSNEGYFTVSFDIGLDAVDEDMRHSLNIYIKSTDTAELSIATLDSQLVLTASGVKSAEPIWTGRYELTDEVSLVTFDNVINVLGFTEQASAGWSEKPKYLELTATEAVLHGTAELRSNSEAKSGKDIDFIGTYPDNVAEFDFTLSDPVSATITFKAASNGGRYFNIYIDDTLVKTDLRVDSGSWTTGKIYNVVSNHSFTKGAHTIKFARGSGSDSPLLDYVFVDWR
jgi:hypothetical protein